MSGDRIIAQARRKDRERLARIARIRDAVLVAEIPVSSVPADDTNDANTGESFSTENELINYVLEKHA